MSGLSPLGDILVLGLTRSSYRVYKTVFLLWGILRTPSRCSLWGSRSNSRSVRIVASSELVLLLNLLCMTLIECCDEYKLYTTLSEEFPCDVSLPLTDNLPLSQFPKSPRLPGPG